MEPESIAISQRLAVILIAAIFAVTFSRLAYVAGFFTLPESEPHVSSNIGWKRTFIAFSIFMAVNIILPGVLLEVAEKAPETVTSSGLVGEGTIEAQPIADNFIKNWANIFLIFASFISLSAYYLSLEQSDRNEIWGRPENQNRSSSPLRDFFIGALSWFIFYPWTLIAGQIVAIIISLISDLPQNDQVAVKLIKDLHDKPLILGFTVVSVFTVVPFLEELLFRGFLQSWMKNLFSMKLAILITSLIFALFHFGTEQGISNFELLISLFILSCFMGFLKEKRQSLWASIGLHSAFNFVSLSMLLALQ